MPSKKLVVNKNARVHNIVHRSVMAKKKLNHCSNEKLITDIYIFYRLNFTPDSFSDIVHSSFALFSSRANGNTCVTLPSE